MIAFIKHKNTESILNLEYNNSISNNATSSTNIIKVPNSGYKKNPSKITHITISISLIIISIFITKRHKLKTLYS